MIWRDVAAILLSYGLGCCVTGYYLVRWKTGQDIRTIGSGSAGARNVGRILGRWGFWTTLSADILRGCAASLGAYGLGVSEPVRALCVLAATGGHIFPIQLGFRGGKGIGVSLGALAVFDWRIAAGSMLLCAVLYLVSRRYMLSGMISVLTAPIAAVVLGLPTSSSVILAVWAGLILLAHRKNLFDLYQDKTHSEGDKPYGDGENGDRRIHI